jgi:hypothetical protein
MECAHLLLEEAVNGCSSGEFFLSVKCLPLEVLEVQARVMACTTQSGKGIGCEQRCQEA